MKRFLCLLLVCALWAGAFTVYAESVPYEGPGSEEAGEDGDDSVIVPVDLPDEGETEEETLTARTLQYGDEGDDVLEIQMRLQDLRYYTGNLSGRYREGTRAAVTSFQADFDLEETGIADALTQSVLFSALYRPLRYGSEGDDVKELQTRLMELGYYKGKISGNYLEGTQSGIRRFQEVNGLTVNGEADPETQEALFSAKAIGRYDPEAIRATGSPNPSTYLVDDQDTAANNGVTLADEPIPFTKVLKSGSSGKTVKELQTRMAALGYYDGPISGNFAKKTVRAVKKIQTQNGMDDTGKVDEATWNLIFNDAKIVMPNHTPKPTPSPTPVPFAITVDVENQVTTVYGRDENGEYNVVVRQMLCSTGTKKNPSDVGDWVLNGRHANWCVFPKWGNSYARYWTRINSSIAFHSVIYTAVSTSAVNVSSYKMLGHRASHGCIRLTVEDAKWICDNIGAGTVCSIVEGMKPDPELRDALKLPPYDRRLNGPAATPVPTAEPEYRSDREPDLEGKAIKRGGTGESVYWAQRRLTELGYYRGKCSGKILNGTMEALKSFQRAAKLRVNGVLNQETLDALYAAETPTPTPAPTPTPEPASEPAEAV